MSEHSTGRKTFVTVLPDGSRILNWSEEHWPKAGDRVRIVSFGGNKIGMAQWTNRTGELVSRWPDPEYGPNGNVLLDPFDPGGKPFPHRFALDFLKVIKESELRPVTCNDVERRLGALIVHAEKDRAKNLIPFGNAMTSIAWCVGYLARNKGATFEISTHHYAFGLATVDGRPELDRDAPSTCVLAVGWTQGEKVKGGKWYEVEPGSLRSYVTIGVGRSLPGKGIISVWPEAFGGDVPLNSWEDWAKVEAPDRFSVELDVVREWFGPELLAVVEQNLPVYSAPCRRVREATNWKAHEHPDPEEAWSKVEAAIAAWGDRGHGFKGVTSQTGLILA